MGNLIIFEEKEVQAKGLNPHNQVDEKKLKEYFFEEDYERLKLLRDIDRINLDFERPKLLYPGCGSDIFLPLIYLEELFPEVKEADFIFVEENNSLGIIKTLLDRVGISFEEKKNRISFYWNSRLIHLEFFQEDIAELLPKLPKYHLYFERAFRIMREQIKDYEKNIFEKLIPGGVLISDSGFEDAPLERIEVPSELSTYGEMIMGRKR